MDLIHLNAEAAEWRARAKLQLDQIMAGASSASPRLGLPQAAE